MTMIWLAQKKAKGIKKKLRKLALAADAGRWRQHTSAYVEIRQHTSAYVELAADAGRWRFRDPEPS